MVVRVIWLAWWGGRVFIWPGMIPYAFLFARLASRRAIDILWFKPLVAGCRVPEECPAAIAQLVSDCLKHDPLQRPNARNVVMRIRDACGGTA